MSHLSLTSVGGTFCKFDVPAQFAKIDVFRSLQKLEGDVMFRGHHDYPFSLRLHRVEQIREITIARQQYERVV